MTEIAGKLSREAREPSQIAATVMVPDGDEQENSSAKDLDDLHANRIAEDGGPTSGSKSRSIASTIIQAEMLHVNDEDAKV